MQVLSIFFVICYASPLFVIVLIPMVVVYFKVMVSAFSLSNKFYKLPKSICRIACWEIGTGKGTGKNNVPFY